MKHIAVVDDDTIFLGMMAAVLADGGWDTKIYREKNHAFEGVQHDPPDLIILDIRMESPETGWTLLELFTLDPMLCTVPVIVCSAALLDLQAHQEWLSQNGIAILPKPFNIDQLYEAVEGALQQQCRPHAR
jgi:two-component system sensor histidine kinase/response regulator